MLLVMRARITSCLAAALLAMFCALPGSADASHVKLCHRPHTTDDASARVLARTAQTAAETYATDHNGEYVGLSPGRLRSIEPTLALTPRQARHEQDGAYLLTARGGRDSYNVTARALNGDTFTIVREPSGEIERVGRVCGIAVRVW